MRAAGTAELGKDSRKAAGSGPLMEHGAQIIHGTRATFRLYYVMEQNAPSTAQLVVVGIDTRRSGHYEYFSVDTTVSSENKLHAKNKTAVGRWLGQQKGAEVTADRGIVARIAEPPESSICSLLLTHAEGNLAAGVAAKLQEGLQAPAEPAKAGPPGQAGADTTRRDGWNGLFECCYKDREGRKLMKLVLRDTNGGREMAVVYGGETRAGSRRYLYQALPALGGDMFPSRQEALDWIHTHFKFQPGEPAACVPQQGPVPQSGGAVAVSSVFHDGPLAQWALSDPDTSLMKQLTHSASLLDELRSRSVSASGMGEVSRDRAVAHVVHLLDELAAPRVGMQALDMSHIVFSVLPYLRHPNQDIAKRASRLVATWRDQARRTEALVQDALNHLPRHEH